jgi:hypothetical protein
MNTMRRVVHVPYVQLRDPSLIYIPPKSKGRQMTLPLTVITMKSHLSLRWSLFVGFRIFGWLKGSRKRITIDVGKSVKCVPKVVMFWAPHLFLRRGSHMLLNQSVFHSRGGSFRWSEFDKFGGG